MRTSATSLTPYKFAMRKALIVGLDYYHDLTPLSGCVIDANAVANVLGRHANETTNFTTPKVLTSTAAHNAVNRDVLRDSIEALFKDDSEIALLYFAVHGYVDETGGF